jgi:hypothetical protein
MIKKTSKSELKEDGNKLLPGEKLSFKDPDSKISVTDEELNRRYVKGEIRIVTETARYSLAGLLAMLQEDVPTDENGKTEKRYKLDPEYQRRHRWSVDRKSRLIESFLMNVPVPPVFLYERDLARFEVMDGRQRLTALSEFYDDKFKLEGLQYWTGLHGKTYSTLPSKVRDGIDRRYISSIILLQETAQNEEQASMLKKMVFERLNAGGVRLSSQETRNAVYEGPLNRLCFQLSENLNFRSMWGVPNEVVLKSEDDREMDNDEETEASGEGTRKGRRMFEQMEEVELVLRFFAYRQIMSWPSGLNKINGFLDRFLIEGNKFKPETLSEYRKMFESTISFVFELLGNEAFHRVKSGKPTGGPTKIVYDPIMYVSAKYSSGPDCNTLLARKNVLIERINKIKQDDIFAGRRTNSVDTNLRNKHVVEIFNSVLKNREVEANLCDPH